MAHRRFKAGLPISTWSVPDAIRFIACSRVTAMRDVAGGGGRRSVVQAPADSLINGSPTAARGVGIPAPHAPHRWRRHSNSIWCWPSFQRHADFPEGVRALLIDKNPTGRSSDSTDAHGRRRALPLNLPGPGARPSGSGRAADRAVSQAPRHSVRDPGQAAVRLARRRPAAHLDVSPRCDHPAVAADRAP
jgi:hypothetical protein